MTFYDACRAILKDPKADAFAQTYAARGLSLDPIHPGHSDVVRIQALYILSNLKHWRHPDAKLVRATLRQIGEVK